MRYAIHIHSVRWAGAGAGGWSGVREKYCWLAGGWKLVLERCEKKTLLGWRLLELPKKSDWKELLELDTPRSQENNGDGLP